MEHENEAENLVECEACHGLFREDEITVMLCSNCLETASRCSHCEGWFDNQSMTEVEHTNLCESCYEDDTFYCEHCDESYLTSRHEYYSACIHHYDRQNSHEIIICDDCYFNDFSRCDRCGLVIPDGERIADGDVTLCQHCYGDYYFTCNGCDHIYHYDNCCSTDDGSYCVECYQHYRSGGIHDYSYKPEPLFHAEDSEHGVKPFYGIELETDNYDDPAESAEAFQTDETDYYMKADGSLSSGIEFVFHPRTLASWEKFDFNALISKIKEQGGKSFDTRTCGLHIHRSRADLSDLDITKLISVMVKLERDICRVAQRHATRWSSFSWEKYDDDKFYYKSVKDKACAYNRYVALNLQNRATVEFRVFKGTLKVPTIRAYLTFAHYFVDWTKNTLNVIQAVKWGRPALAQSFMNYVQATKDKNLISYMKAKHWGE